MTVCHLLLGSNPTPYQFHNWVSDGWISFRSEGMIIFSVKVDCFYHYHVSLQALCVLLLDTLCSVMLVSSISYFFPSLFLISLYMQYILLNTNQAILGLICFALLWLKPKILPYVYSFFSFMSLCFFLFSIYMLNKFVGIALCVLGLNSINDALFTYFMEHFL